MFAKWNFWPNMQLCSIPHAFTLVLLELVASAMLFPCKQQLLINARMN